MHLNKVEVKGRVLQAKFHSSMIIGALYPHMPVVEYEAWNTRSRLNFVANTQGWQFTLFPRRGAHLNKWILEVLVQSEGVEFRKCFPISLDLPVLENIEISRLELSF